jgi:LysM repeat protein
VKYYLYKVLLLAFKGLISIKRGVVWVWKYVRRGGSRVYEWYKGKPAFYLYKGLFVLRKRMGKYWIPFDSRFVEYIGRRGTLQAVFFIAAVLVMVPQSRLYSQDISNIPGQNTLLYELVGPGDQYFEEDAITVEEANFDDVGPKGPAWRQGAVVVDSSVATGKEVAKEVKDISAISVGGSALTKPSILPGTDLPTIDPSTQTTNRRNAIVYEVQQGDVVGAIAEKFGVSVNTILWANNLTARSYIRPGDELKILPQSGLVHMVKKGDTVLKIAQLYDAETQEIVESNRLQKDGADIVIGEELFIPGGEKPQPVIVYSSRPSTFSRVSAPPPSINVPAGAGYIWPTNVRHISQYFGWRHTGLDIAGPTGSPLYASRGGTVIKSQCGWNGGYGCYVVLDHGGGVTTLYGHASQLYVSVGQSVSQGQTIAAMGNTGRSTGPHIHFEVRVGGSKQNPLRYVR